MSKRAPGLMLACAVALVLAGAAAATRSSPGIDAILAQPHVLFTTGHDPADVLGAAQFGTVAGPHALATFRCQYVDFAGGRGACLKTTSSKSAPYVGFAFDHALRFLIRFRLTGAPLSVRVRPDGLVAAYTVGTFVDRDEDTGQATRTRAFFVNLTSGQTLAMDQFAVLGAPRRPLGARLYSHVSFDPAHLNRFYAAMIDRGTSYLVRGDFTRRTVRVVRSGVTLPSVSPDGAQIAFMTYTKRPRLSVLDLGTNRAHFVAETRDVEDQPTWLDGDRLLYPLATGPKKGDELWVSRADGRGAPHVFLRAATSPSVVTEGRP